MADELFFSKFRSHFLTLPPRQRAGFFVWPSLAGPELTPNETQLLNTIKPSGLVLFKRNLLTLRQSKKLIQSYQSLIEQDIPSEFHKTFLSAIDEEGGRVSRLPFLNARGKSALEWGDSQDKEGLINQIVLQCTVAKHIGINCLLAPVADVLTETKNTVMGDRCFARDPWIASDYAALVDKTIREEGLWSCGKHFPGHGNTITDSHLECSLSHASISELLAREWVPFNKLISQNIPLLMAAHVITPSLDPNLPATLSPVVLKNYLRKQLKFSGLILSDDLRMNAIAHHYGVDKKQDSSITEEINGNQLPQEDTFLAKASIDALKAGCDILLSCQSIERELVVVDAIAEKLDNDRDFSEEMIDKAWRIFQVLQKNPQITPS